jgi:hypothetical protein
MKYQRLYAEMHQTFGDTYSARAAKTYDEFAPMHITEPHRNCDEMGSLFNRCCLVASRGGAEPSLEFLDIHSGRPERRAQLESGHTPYSLDVSPGGSAFAYGTRRGRIGVEKFGNHVISGDATSLYVDISEPILSVCFLRDNELAVSTSEEKLYVFSVSDSGSLRQSYLIAGSTYCALKSAGNGVLVALSTGGDLHLFAAPFTSPKKVVAGPRPPRKSAMSTICYWDRADKLAYPVAGGSLALLELESGVLRIMPAHHGDFYATLQVGEHLITIGSQDRLCHVWCPDNLCITSSCRAPRGILTGTPLADSSNQLVGLDDCGNAAVYEIADEALHKRMDIKGENYRTVAGPQHRAYNELKSNWIKGQVESACEMLLTSLNIGDERETVAWHERLKACGAEPTSLRIQARHAATNGELSASLIHCKRLVDIIVDDLEHVDLLLYAAETFERAWCLGNAAATYARANAITSSHALSEIYQLVTQTIKIMTDSPWVIDDQHLSAQQISHAVNFLGEQISGRILLKKLEPIVCQGATLVPSRIRSKFQDLRQAEKWSDCVTSVDLDVWWLDYRSRVKTSTLVFGRTDSLGLAGVELVVKVLHQDQHTLLLPCITQSIQLQSACHYQLPTDGVAISRLDEISQNSHALNVWIRDIESLLGQAVWRLKNELEGQ